MLELLAKHGADLNQMLKNGFTPLHLTAKRNYMDCARTLIQNGAIPDAGSRNGYTSLHLVSQDGQLPFVRMLVEEYGANPNTAANVSDSTGTQTSAIDTCLVPNQTL